MFSLVDLFPMSHVVLGLCGLFVVGLLFDNVGSVS